MRRVNHREQMCYLVGIDDVGEDIVFHIVKKNFKITQAPLVPFPSEVPTHAVPGDAVNPDRTSNRNTTANIEGGLSRAATREEIEQLRQQGITVDDDNEPAPENAQAPEVGAAPPPGIWEKPQYCCRRAAQFSDTAGRFVHHRWDEIAEMDELQLFGMCFPE